MLKRVFVVLLGEIFQICQPYYKNDFTFMIEESLISDMSRPGQTPPVQARNMMKDCVKRYQL